LPIGFVRSYGVTSEEAFESDGVISGVALGSDAANSEEAVGIGWCAPAYEVLNYSHN
jgi:hypothetical protein